MAGLKDRSARPALAFVLVTALLSMCLAACRATAQSDDMESVSITLERTACYGTCPVYAVTIHGSGLVEYFGKLHVDIPGTQKAAIQRDRLNGLLKMFDAIHFTSLKDSYFGPCRDIPTAIISLGVNGNTKRVGSDSGCEPEKSRINVDLSKLAEQIDAVAGTDRWVKCDHDGLKKLVGVGFDVNGQAPNGDTALLIAVQKRDLANVRLLLDAGAQVNAADGQGLTPLMRAVMDVQTAIARELLARGADVKAKDRKGFTALEMTGDAELRKVLVNAGGK